MKPWSGRGSGSRFSGRVLVVIIDLSALAGLLTLGPSTAITIVVTARILNHMIGSDRANEKSKGLLKGIQDKNSVA